LPEQQLKKIAVNFLNGYRTRTGTLNSHDVGFAGRWAIIPFGKRKKKSRGEFAKAGAPG
jgi:hypothetical protein